MTPRFRLLLGLALAACGARPARTGPSPSDAPGSAALTGLVDALARREHAPALSVAIAQGDHVVFARGEGFADLARRVPAGPHTRYRIGSLAKLLTATAAARLADRGLFDWDADIRRYVPEWPDKGEVITPRMLAGHLAGIRHYGPGEYIRTVHYDSLAPTIAIFSHDSLLSRPGARYFYSSYGFNLLGLAIERAAHRPFVQVVTRDVFEPLGLHDARFVGRWTPDRDDAEPLALDSLNRAVAAPRDDLTDRWPSGGVLASAMDLVRFGTGVLKSQYLRAGTLRMMTTPQHPANGTSIVGLGWRVGTDSGGRTIWHHAGASNGGRSLLVVWPAETLAIAVASNAPIGLAPADVFAMADQVRMARHER